MLAGIALFAAFLFLFLPDILAAGKYQDLSQAVRPTAAFASDRIVTAESEPVDLEEVAGYVPEARSWISVDRTYIDYPVVQGDDNEYYLHHDAWGNWSYSGVYADCNADVDGRNVVIYGHTLIGGGMFTPLSEARYQNVFDGLGTVRYSTFDLGERAFTPVAALHVSPDFADACVFEFPCDNEFLRSAAEALLAEHAASGECNAVIEGSAADRTADDGTTRVPEDALWSAESVEVDSEGRVWVLTDSEKAGLQKAAETASWARWATSLCEKADAVRSDWRDLVDSSSESVVLACCSWPFDNHRTLVLCVR